MAKLCSFNLSWDCSKQYFGFGAQMYRTFYEITVFCRLPNIVTDQHFGVLSGDLYTQLLGKSQHGTYLRCSKHTVITDISVHMFQAVHQDNVCTFMQHSYLG